MTARNRNYLLAAIGGVAVVVALLFHFKERDTYRCQLCFAKKDVFQWRAGAWMGISVPLTPSWERVGETRFLDDLLPPDHTHDWQFAQGSPYRFFGTTWGGCALGGGRRGNDLTMMYEQSDEFRDFIKGKLRAGTLEKSNLIAMMSSPRAPGEKSPLQQAAADLLDAFFEH